MGTVFSLDVRGPDPLDGAVDDAVRWLHWVDATFSTYKPDSVISRMRRGEDVEHPPEVDEVLALAGRIAEASNGYFTVTPHGVLDPTGVVKGWAVERAADLLRAAGSTSHSLNGGGDIQLLGDSSPGRAWRVGIAHPLRPGELAAVVSGTDLAVATSGIAERGTHIVDPVLGAPADGLASLTVVGARLSWVDACATAAFAMGPGAGLAWVEDQDGLEAFEIGLDGGLGATSGFGAFGGLVERRSA